MSIQVEDDLNGTGLSIIVKFPNLFKFIKECLLSG